MQNVISLSRNRKNPDTISLFLVCIPFQKAIISCTAGRKEGW